MRQHEQNNARVVRQTYENFRAGNVPAVLAALAQDVHWQLPEMEDVPFAGSWRGRDAVGRFFATVAQIQEPLEFEPREFLAQGDKVMVLGRFSWRVKSTGALYSSDWAHVWTLRRGQVTRFHEYVDTGAVTRGHKSVEDQNGT